MAEVELITISIETETGLGTLENVVSWGFSDGWFTVRVRAEDGDRLLWYPLSRVRCIDTPWSDPVPQEAQKEAPEEAQETENAEDWHQL